MEPHFNVGKRAWQMGAAASSRGWSVSFTEDGMEEVTEDGDELNHLRKAQHHPQNVNRPIDAISNVPKR